MGELRSFPVQSSDAQHAQHGVVRAQVEGRADDMEPEQRASIDGLADCLREAGFDPELSFKEPGGRGIAPLESIVLFLEPHVVSGVVGGAAWAAITAVTNWARKRIRRAPPDPVFPDEHVSLRMYSGEGRLVSDIKITTESVEHLHIHPAIADDERVRKDSPVMLQPGSRGHLGVTTATGSVSCLIKSGWVGCETPATNWPAHEDGTPFHSFACDAHGQIEWADGQMGDMPRVTVTPGNRYHAFDWSILAVEDGLALINERTGHGVRVTPEEVREF